MSPDLIERTPTGAVAAAGLIAGFGVAVGTGSRPLGGVVMLLFAAVCVYTWLQRDDRRTATRLTIVGLVAFIVSHGLGLLIGAWPSVFVVSIATAWFCWRWSDSRHAVLGRAAVRA